MDWVKSGRCDGGSCFEARVENGRVHVRNNQEPDKMLVLTLEQWNALQDEIAAGSFRFGVVV